MNLKPVFFSLIVLCLFVSACEEDIPGTQDNADEDILPQDASAIEKPVDEDITIPMSETQQMSDGVIREYRWDYKGREWWLKLTVYPEVYVLYKERSRLRDYDLFASDPYDDEFIKEIAESLKKLGLEYGLENEDIPYFVASFVQSLQYTSDKVTSGYDEYPRFPYETFYDDGGDCEDTSILTAALLEELGYGAVLLELPSHMAVGVYCNEDVYGYSYNYLGKRYCYLETTGENWDVGEMPEEYKEDKATIIPVIKKPVLQIAFDANYTYNMVNVYTDIFVNVTNLGSETAKNTKIYVALQTRDAGKVWSQIESESLEIYPEEIYEYTVTNMHSPGGKDFRIYVRAYGDNVLSDEATSDWIAFKKN